MKKWLFLFLILIITVPVIAQNNSENDSALTGGKFGLTGYAAKTFIFDSEYGFNKWIGAVWHVSDSIALKPSFMLISKTDKYENNLTNQSATDDISNMGFGLEVLYYFNPQSKLSFFAGPSIRYQVYTDMDRNTDGSWDDKKRTYLYLNLHLGAQYTFNRHFAVFADMSFGLSSYKYTSQNFDSSETLTDDDENTTTAFQSIYGRFGLIFYL